MKISKNIIYNSEILKSEKSNVHIQNLEIASKNLDDLNKRLSNDVNLVYDELTFKFNYQSYTELSHKVKVAVNNYCSWSYQEDKETQEWANLHTERILDEKDGILKYIYNPTLKDIPYFQELRLSFINVYKDHAPLGFLKPEIEKIIKEKVNTYCSELSEVPAK